MYLLLDLWLLDLNDDAAMTWVWPVAVAADAADFDETAEAQ
jgi:hypothetical protein